MGGLQRPDTPFQPLEQRHIVGGAAKHCLTEMNVGLNKSRQEIAASGVDHFVVTAPGIRADRDDAPVPDGHRAIDDVETIVHGHDRRVANEDRTGPCGRRARGRGWIGVGPRHSVLTWTSFTAVVVFVRVVPVVAFMDSRLVSTPRLTAISSARMLIAISA